MKALIAFLFFIMGGLGLGSMGAVLLFGDGRREHIIWAVFFVFLLWLSTKVARDKDTL